MIYPPLTEKDIYKAIIALQEKTATREGQKWFWGDSQEASNVRQFLYNLTYNHKSVGRDVIGQIFDLTDDDIKKGIANKKLSKELGEDRMKDYIATKSNEFVKDEFLPGMGVALAPITAAEAILSPVIATGSTIGGLVGGKIAENASAGKSYGFLTPEEHSGFDTASVSPVDRIAKPMGEFTGAVLGGMAAGGLKSLIVKGGGIKPSFKPSDYNIGIENPVEIGQGTSAPTNGPAGRTYYQTVGGINPETGRPLGYGKAVDIPNGRFVGLMDSNGNMYSSMGEAYRPGMMIGRSVRTPELWGIPNFSLNAYQKGGFLKRIK